LDSYQKQNIFDEWEKLIFCLYLIHQKLFSKRRMKKQNTFLTNANENKKTKTKKQNKIQVANHNVAFKEVDSTRPLSL
jgi:hypothetical protein